jgi:two-component system phosphate regulon sensor histidine kinase PhoR
MGSAAELERVFVNLLSNATRYARENVCASMVATDQWIEVTVRDDGTGIAPEHLPKLFDRFYRVDDDRNSESGGNGLGLAITQSIVHRHGGTISIDSEVGRGTKVVVRLPRITS